MRRTLPLRTIALLLVCCLLAACSVESLLPVPTARTEATTAPDSAPPAAAADNTNTLQARPQIVNAALLRYAADFTPSLPAYTVPADGSGVVNWERSYLSDEYKSALVNNLFVVAPGYSREFFERYEQNRYNREPNFVTVDSMMHTYHLYFSYLMKTTEREHLAGKLTELAKTMLENTQAQCYTLSSTEWARAAQRNLAFFAVGVKLLDPLYSVPASVSETVSYEVDRINDAAGIDISALTGAYEDYSQYTVRGYYTDSSELQAYFKAMMWFGRMNFAQEDESLDRSALLMTLAVGGEAEALWGQIYSVTAFFAGASDDYSYYEYRQLAERAYGKLPTMGELMGNSEAWQTFHSLTGALPAPKINSVPADDKDGDANSQNKGFRFMGQRFTLDEAIFERLTYDDIGEDPAGNRRMLPMALDVPAALGSDLALTILESQGAADYAGYRESMNKLRADRSLTDDTLWSQSLYAGWLNTLQPLLTVKGAGYPSFMQGQLWATHSLESYCGSFTELKHDTVLYAKQMMAEMGGGELPEVDDRGYVEPEPAVYVSLSSLVEQTAQGLSSFGLLSTADAVNLNRLKELAAKLAVISEKELRGELPTDEEFELIRGYGGTLEHFWEDTVRGLDNPEGFLDSALFPAAIVTDVATDPNGSVLELGTGNPSVIYVVVPVDGVLRICSGTVFSFYEFTQPLNERLTDTEWRQAMGIELTNAGRYVDTPPISQPSWTVSYRKE